MSLPINPETRVGALLEAYPGIDEVLISWVPAFAKLRNPMLRKTVAKVATLEQAARIGALEAENATLRQEMDDLEARVAALETTAGVSPPSQFRLPDGWWLLGGLVAITAVMGQRRYLGGGR